MVILIELRRYVNLQNGTNNVVKKLKVSYLFLRKAKITKTMATAKMIITLRSA